jgi:hypothetical protein
MSEAKLLYEGMPNLLPMQGRSAGLHVSDVIHELCIRLEIFSGNVEAQPNNSWMQLGCALEDALVRRFEEHYPGKYTRVGELELDGLYGTPDLVNVEDWADEEIKLAWMSSNQPVDGKKMWRYWVQIKAYCKMIESNLGRLHVCHVNGDWKGQGPVYRVWEQQFTNGELNENWAMLQTHAAAMRTRGGKISQVAL